MSLSAQTDGYSHWSIIVHWLTAFLVIALFLTHEGDRGSAAYVFHVSGGAIAGLFLLWRVWLRARRGIADHPPQAALLTLVSKLVLWGFLAAIAIVVITGYFLPWSLGRPLDIFGFAAIPSPMGMSRPVHEFTEELHELAGYAFVPLLVLHILGAAKHAIIDKDGIAQRMFKSVSGGR